MNYKKPYAIHILNLKQALNHGWNLEKVHRMFKFNKLALLNPCIDMNNELAKNDWKKKREKNAKNDVEKDFYKLIID